MAVPCVYPFSGARTSEARGQARSLAHHHAAEGAYDYIFNRGDGPHIL